jgi:hypothetical protein
MRWFGAEAFRSKHTDPDSVVTKAQSEMSGLLRSVQEAAIRAIQRRNIVRAVWREADNTARRLDAAIALAVEREEVEVARRIRNDRDRLQTQLDRLTACFERVDAEAQELKRCVTVFELTLCERAGQELAARSAVEDDEIQTRLNAAMVAASHTTLHAEWERSERQIAATSGKVGDDELDKCIASLEVRELDAELLATLRELREVLEQRCRWQPPDDPGGLGPPTASAPVVPR